MAGFLKPWRIIIKALTKGKCWLWPIFFWQYCGGNFFLLMASEAGVDIVVSSWDIMESHHNHLLSVINQNHTWREPRNLILHPDFQIRIITKGSEKFYKFEVILKFKWNIQFEIPRIGDIQTLTTEQISLGLINDLKKLRKLQEDRRKQEVTPS